MSAPTPPPSDFRARLRRLRREDVPPPAGEAAPRGLPDSLRRRLARGAAPQRGERDDGAAPRELAALGPPADLAARDTLHGRFRARTRRFPLEHRHGEYQLDEACLARREELALLTGDPSLAELDLARAVYLDTETTGLAGGAGTYVFLVGLGTFDETGFELWQGFLQGPGEERALLGAAAERIRAAGALVSFFGKSFDRHRLADRMRILGLDPPFDAAVHLDLYHPLRRLYRGAHEDCRLRTLERELCGVEREQDLPGARAPEAWFDFLAGRPHRLEGVFRHNADDVLSLVTLAAHLARAREGRRAGGQPLAGDPVTRALGIARSLVALRRRAEALSILESALASLRAGCDARPLLALRAQLRAARRS